MAPIVLSEFTLTVEIDVFLDIFWHKAGWYEEFLTEQLKDISVNVGDWAPAPDKPSAQSRTVHSFHPAKISFPGLPSHAESWKVQTLEVMRDGTGAVNKISVKETNSFRGIPYADYFNVNTEWTVVAVEEDSSNPSEQKPTAPQKKCKAIIHLDFQFLKSTWLQGTIESNTKAELIEVYELWLQMAQETLRRSLDQRMHGSTSAGNLSLPGSGADVEQAVGSGEGQADDGSSLGGGGYEVGGALMRSGESTPVAKSRSLSSGYPSDADEELQFFDCEDGGGGRGTSFGNASTGDLAAQARLAADLQRYYPQSFGGGVRELQSGGALLGKDMRAQHGFPVPGAHTGSDGLEGGPTSTRDIAVTIVEAVFVLAEFSYWQVHQLYAYELKEVFDIDPAKVVTRVLNSFLPGWHSPLLLQPDLYGPVLAVAALPQSLLISMEISRHGCNPTSQLGNALVVSLFIWMGLSAIYRLLALLVAPGIEFKHCLCVTGYGFFAWNVALLCIFPLENLYDTLQVPTMLPLVIFGLPSSLAQGAMFWEHTPASSLTLQPSQLPQSMQRFATTHNRCLQRILWLLPKVLAFLLVAGTHYQFLWYMARVFLPGRRQLCKLSALVQPSHYADILTQKELRNFAISLFGKN